MPSGSHRNVNLGRPKNAPPPDFRVCASQRPSELPTGRNLALILGAPRSRRDSVHTPTDSASPSVLPAIDYARRELTIEFPPPSRLRPTLRLEFHLNHHRCPSAAISHYASRNPKAHNPCFKFFFCATHQDKLAQQHHDNHARLISANA